jgi:hypothetical protein
MLGGTGKGDFYRDPSLAGEDRDPRIAAASEFSAECWERFEDEMDALTDVIPKEINPSASQVLELSLVATVTPEDILDEARKIALTAGLSRDALDLEIGFFKAFATWSVVLEYLPDGGVREIWQDLMALVMTRYTYYDVEEWKDTEQVLAKWNRYSHIYRQNPTEHTLGFAFINEAFSFQEDPRHNNVQLNQAISAGVLILAQSVVSALHVLAEGHGNSSAPLVRTQRRLGRVQFYEQDSGAGMLLTEDGLPCRLEQSQLGGLDTYLREDTALSFEVWVNPRLSTPLARRVALV